MDCEISLINYERYGKISLTENGRLSGMEVIRKHRLWETFLYQKLGFNWTEVHEVAEQLEHIHSSKLVDSLDEFLGFPKFDPHGDPIPNTKGEIELLNRKTLDLIDPGHLCQLVAVKDNATDFLHYVDKLGLTIGEMIFINSKESYDDLLHVKIHEKHCTISKKLAENLYVQIADEKI